MRSSPRRGAGYGSYSSRPRCSPGRGSGFLTKLSGNEVTPVEVLEWTQPLWLHRSMTCSPIIIVLDVPSRMSRTPTLRPARRDDSGSTGWGVGGVVAELRQCAAIPLWGAGVEDLSVLARRAGASQAVVAHHAEVGGAGLAVGRAHVVVGLEVDRLAGIGGSR